jgi:hypothetical protein
MEIPFTIDLAVLIQIVMVTPTLMRIGLQRLIATVLMLSRTTRLNGAMRTTMDLEATLMETILMIVLVKQVHRTKINSVVLTEMVMGGQTLATHSQTIAHSGPIPMVTTTVTTLMETILTRSRTTLLNGVIKTEMAMGITLVEPTETASQLTHFNGQTLTMMAMVTILSMLMKMVFRKGTPTFARKPTVNQPVQLLEDVLTAMVTVTQTLRMHSLISRFNGKIPMKMAMGITRNSQKVTNVSMSLARACTTDGKGALILTLMDMQILMGTGNQSLIALAQMRFLMTLSNGATRMAMVLETTTS